MIMMRSLSLLELFGDLGGNSVHVGGTLLGQSLSNNGGRTVVIFDGNLADKSSSLQFDESVSDALSSRVSLVLGAGSVSLFTTVVFSEGVDSNLSSHVELIGDGGSSDVEPVIIIWCEISST